MTKNKGLKIREGKIYLDSQSKKGIVSFVSPAFGPGNYVNVGNSITEAGLEQPTMEQTVSLIYNAWQNPKEKYSSDVINKLKKNWLWAFNGLLYFPNEGIYIQDRPKIENGKILMDKKDLTKKLESNDSSVRFVPFDSFKKGFQSPLELAKNTFIQALAGKEGVDKLASVANRYKIKPYVWTINKNDVNEMKIRVAGLNSVRFFDFGRLIVGCYCWDGGDGFAFGIHK